MIYEFKCIKNDNVGIDGLRSSTFHACFKHVYCNKYIDITSLFPLPYIVGRIYLLDTDKYVDYSFSKNAYDDSIHSLNSKYGEFNFQCGLIYPEDLQGLFSYLEDVKLKHIVFLPDQAHHVE